MTHVIYQKTLESSPTFGTRSVTIFLTDYFIMPPKPYPYNMIQGHITSKFEEYPTNLVIFLNEGSADLFIGTYESLHLEGPY